MISTINSANPLDSAKRLMIDALGVQKKAFHIATENMANAETVARPGHRPYQKKVVLVMEKNMPRGPGQTMKVHQGTGGGKKVHDPAHPYADAQGDITVSDIDTTQEMVNAMGCKTNIDRLTRLHKMAHDLNKQELDFLAEK